MLHYFTLFMQHSYCLEMASNMFVNHSIDIYIQGGGYVLAVFCLQDLHLLVQNVWLCMVLVDVVNLRCLYLVFQVNMSTHQTYIWIEYSCFNTRSNFAMISGTCNSVYMWNILKSFTLISIVVVNFFFRF